MLMNVQSMASTILSRNALRSPTEPRSFVTGTLVSDGMSRTNSRPPISTTGISRPPTRPIAGRARVDWKDLKLHRQAGLVITGGEMIP